MYHWFFTSWVAGVGIFWFWNVFGCLVLYAVCCAGGSGGEEGDEGTRVGATAAIDRHGARELNNWAPFQEEDSGVGALDGPARGEGGSDEDPTLRWLARGRAASPPASGSIGRADGPESDDDDLAEILASGAETGKSINDGAPPGLGAPQPYHSIENVYYFDTVLRRSSRHRLSPRTVPLHTHTHPSFRGGAGAPIIHRP